MGGQQRSTIGDAIRILAGASVLLLILCTRASAGTTGALSGFVYEVGSLKPIPGIVVVVTTVSGYVETFEQTTTTDQHGFYSFVSLAPDRYHLQVRASDPDIVGGLCGTAIVDADMTTYVDLEAWNGRGMIADCFSPKTIQPPGSIDPVP